MQRSVESSQEITINDPLEAATSIITSSPLQQSPFSNYVNNLSPIKAVNPTSKDFVGLNSLPSIFTSPQPRINPQGGRHHYWNSVDDDPVETHGHNVEEPPLLSRESHHGSEVGEKHCGMRRRLLQFDAVSSTPSSESKDTMAQLSEPMTSLFPLNGTGNIGLHLVSSNMGGTEDERHKFHASVAPCAVASLDPANAHDKRKLTWNSDQFNQPARSPEKKKKKTSSTTDGDSCKRCNCKKSKCLKLYCDCFAAGFRCSETCGCQGCFNKTEYEDKIVEAKQQIESRNPLAFAPKIVKRASSNIVDQAKHKRGCNCKKSMCSKRYCECYQANVGCSSGCRCDGCKNVYGRKDDYVAEHGLSKERLSSRVEKGLDSKFQHNNLGMVANMTDSLQFSNHVRQHLPSPEVAGVAIFPFESENSERNVLLAETNEILLGSGSYGWQLGYNKKKTMEIMDQSSATFNSHQRPGFKTRDDTHIPPRPLMSHGISYLLSGWRNSTVTPTMTRLGQNLCSQHQPYDIRQNATPETLNQPVTPIQSVRASFPNQKRVSPPHTGSPQSASTSSAGFISGNNSILKSMPSFLPVTLFKPNHHEDCMNVDGSIPY